ncbi:MAG: hypothetical protein AAF532_02205 [Planctomycetota bacterium]
MPTGTYTVVATPASPSPAVTRAEAKRQLRELADDAEIDRLITAAVGFVERDLALSLTPRTVRASFERFPCVDDPDGLVLSWRYGPVSSLTSIEYRPAGDAWVTLDPADYEVDLASEPPRVAPLDSWPHVPRGLDRVRLTFEAGFTVVPEELKQALLLLVEHWHIEPESAGQLPAAVKPLLANWRYYHAPVA